MGRHRDFQHACTENFYVSRNVNVHQSRDFLNEFNKCTISDKDIISKSQLIFKFQGDISLFWNPYIIHKCLRGKKRDVRIHTEALITAFQKSKYSKLIHNIWWLIQFVYHKMCPASHTLVKYSILSPLSHDQEHREKQVTAYAHQAAKTNLTPKTAKKSS